MRTLLLTVVVLGIGLALITFGIPGVSAYALSSSTASYTKDGTRLPEVSARAWGVFDTDTGQLLFGNDVDGVRPIASVTKLMTAEVALDSLDLEATTTLSRRAITTEGRAGSLEAGEEYSIRELLFPLLLSSSNDAAEAIAEYADRNTFLTQMNETAEKIGMTSTAYGDPSGLSPSSVSSVADLAKLVAYLSHNQQYLLDISQLQNYVGQHTWHNVNKASAIETFRGGKHGYTDEAGRTLAALFEEQLFNGDTQHITIVLLGSEDLKSDVETLRSFLREHVAYR